MTDTEIKDYILSRCHDVGACAEKYKALLESSDIHGILSVYKENPTWCMEIGFPRLDEIREYFNDCESDGIYVDRTFNGETIASQIAIFHNCDGVINVAMDYDNAVIPMMYFCNGCEMHIECRQSNAPAIRVPLYIFGDNFITTNGGGNAIFNRHEHDTK